MNENELNPMRDGYMRSGMIRPSYIRFLYISDTVFSCSQSNMLSEKRQIFMLCYKTKGGK